MRVLLGFVSLWVALVAGDVTLKVEVDEENFIKGDAVDINDRIAMLTVDRTNPDAWCMGLLIAPDAVLAYAHCVSKFKATPLAWAFFGKSREDFSKWQDEATMTVSATGKNVTRRIEAQDVSVGDEDDWVQILQTTIHPEYTSDGSTPTKDLAVLQLVVDRVATTPFSLVANMTEINATTGFIMDAYQTSNNFVKTSQDTKLMTSNRFHKVGWRYCLPPQTKLTSKLVVLEPEGQFCGVVAVVEERRSEKLPETFVVLDNKLVGLSVVDTSATVGHRFIYLSKEANFITKATQKKDMFKTVRFILGGTTSPILRGYVSGLRQSKAGKNFCLGSLIAPKFVLTAAHCVVGVEFSQVSVGSMYSSTEIDGEQIKVKQTFIHPAYNKTSFSNDFAIIELEYISIQTPIALYAGSGAQTEPGKLLTMYGYRQETTDATGKTKPGTLQSVDLPVVDKAQCKKSLQPVVLDDSMMCAGGEEGKDACQGDSGGPLVYKSQSPESLVGMPSSGRGCGVKGLPGLYAVIATAVKFIDEKVDGHRWVTSYPSDSVPTTAAPPPSTSASTSASAKTTTPSNQASQQLKTPTPAPSSPQEARSNDQPTTTASPSQGSAILEQIASQDQWTTVSSVNFQTSMASLVVGSSYVQLTRNVLSTDLLSAPAGTSLATASLSQLTRYAGATSLSFFSSADLGSLASIIRAFDARPLRRRTARFPRQGDDAYTSPCVGHKM